MCVDWNLKWPDVEVFHTKTAIYLNGQHLEVFHIKIFIWNCTFSEMLFPKQHFVHRNSDSILWHLQKIDYSTALFKILTKCSKILWWTQNKSKALNPSRVLRTRYRKWLLKAEWENLNYIILTRIFENKNLRWALILGGLKQASSPFKCSQFTYRMDTVSP